MDLQTPNSGQTCGLAPNQAGAVLSGSGLPQQNGNSFPSQMQSNNGRRIVSHMHPVIYRTRRYMQQQIMNFLSERWENGNQVYHDRATDLVKRLEEALFRTAKTKEEYLNMDTLESRLHVLIKRLMSNGNQLIVNANTYPSIGAMIPTPGFQQTENSSSAGTSSVASPPGTISSSNAVAPLPCNSGSFLPTQKGSFGRAFASGYPHPSHVSTKYTGESNTGTSMNARNMVTQMIPTPGINNANDNDTKSMSNYRTFMNMESSNSMDAFAAVDPTAALHPMLQNQPVHGQNSRSLLNISQHTGGRSNSTFRQESYGLSSGPSNGGLGVMGKDMSVIYSHGVNSGQLEGDGCGAGVADASGSRNSNEPVTSVGSMINNQRLDPASTQFLPKRNLPLMTNNLSNLSSAQQAADGEPQSIDLEETVIPQLQCSFKENSLQHHQHQQPSNEYQGRQIAQHQGGQSKQMQNKLFLLHNSFIQSQHPSNIFSEEKPGIGTQYQDEGQHSQASWSSQSPKMSNQHQENSMENHSRTTHSDQQNLYKLPAKASEQMQELLHPQLIADTTIDFTGHCGGIQPNAALYSQSYSKSGDVSHTSGALSLEQNVQEGFHQQRSGGDVGQLNNLPLEESLSGRYDSSRSAEPVKATGNLCRSHKWLLFLKHARKCSVSEGKCFDRRSCAEVQKLWEHMECCNVPQCKYPRCRSSRGLINHHLRCQDGKCPVCIPVRNFVQERKVVARVHLKFGSLGSVNSSCNTNDTAQMEQKPTLIIDPAKTETPEDLQPPIKRQKIEQGSQPNILENARLVALVSCVKGCEIEDIKVNEQHHDCILVKSEFTGGNLEAAGCAGQSNPGIIEIKENSSAYVRSHEGAPITPNNLAGLAAPQVIKTDSEIEQPKLKNAVSLLENASKWGSKLKAVSMVELFTIEQVQDHIMSLRQWVGQSKAKAERNKTIGHLASKGSCQLCKVEKLIFVPPPIYCTHCGARIKKNAMYYIFESGETRPCFCIPCHNEARGGTIVVDGKSFAKTEMGKKKNNEETEEGWVLCDKCEGWQHQICALFNARKNHGGQAEYICPNCYIEELGSGKHVPLPQSAVLGAKDLPRTNLSDHLEQRLFAKLKQEREGRAKIQGKCYDEVPGAEELVVRVVSSVDKKLDVKPRFLEIFQDQNYPSEFAYKSKAILLFQRIEGVEVCLFGMYVQEYGTECQQPNHRRVYLSYLDSVKYFRPEIKAVTGEALRTFAYHEILIGYLEYCKKRGFTSCYIWACPPLKGEDYILYCHPEIQKTPKSDKLREWYLAMLRKAVKEDIVVDLTNLYDHFFDSNGECKAKVTAARLPYFDGDYWPGAAEDIICQLQQKDGGTGSEQPKKGTIRKGINKRALRASGQTDISCNTSKDLILMQKLGETISPLREDFIMVQLQHACTHCCLMMVSGNRWVCQQCKNFQLCDKCYDAEQMRNERERHPTNQKDKHALHAVEITDVPDDTKDNEIVESEFFDTRHAFLSLCQRNHYQYDTLRRAKHSSMMMLYHLHNPTAPAFATQCALCRLFIEVGQGWHCETCLDYDVCDACYKNNGGKDHPHMLTNKKSNHDAHSEEARKLRVRQLRKMLDLLVHASQCRSETCQDLKCRKVKGLFWHGNTCKTRAAGRCPLCVNMWQLIQLHTRTCRESKCRVPRCKDMKEHMERQQQQSDTRRRDAVMQMMRNRSEVSRNP